MQVSSPTNSPYNFFGTNTSGVGNLRSSPLANLKLSTADGNGDGSLSEAEFEQALAGTTSTDGSNSASSLSTAQADQLFKKIDTNGDGQISADELNAFQQKMQSHMHHHHHHHSESSDTTDATGSASSAPQTLQSLVAQLYKAADTDGNGQLSQAELVNSLSKVSSLL